MKVVALKPILYKSKDFTRVYEKGEIFEMDDVSYYVREKRGDVKAVEGGVDETVEVEDTPAVEGLPPLDEKPTRRKKNENLS